ncbi:MAG: acyl-CoA dehydratase activase [Spirochaetaceae bacterium]|nr:acyl-CoA dehydratase activase [Spirochaetaceae bacterium]
MYSLGLNIGSSSLKSILLEDGKIIWKSVITHDGDFVDAVEKTLGNKEIPEGCRTLVTGTEGRYLFNLNNVIEPLCIERTMEARKTQVDAVVSMGGEDLIVYTIGDKGNIINNFSGSKCASGTGEFFKQQLGRMNMKLDDVNEISDASQVVSLSSRCSVFMKSDCTHRLNKKESTPADIVVSLSNVMSVKVIDFLKKAGIRSGKVLLTGGVAQNRHIVRFMKEKAPHIEFIIPEEAAYFEAFGAALLARESGTIYPGSAKLMKPGVVRFDHLDDLKTATDKVTYFTSDKVKIIEGNEYILGVDGGSTTTKACLIDINTKEVAASHYGRTHGDPIKALRECIVELKKKIKADIGDGKIKITLAATTGSSREILGVFLETGGVYNEIIAHAFGTTFFSDDVDTIFEIGGQDAKYVLLKNKVPIDYAMNEACSAGTGSFLEESAHGDLNIANASEIGDIALQAGRPLKFGEHCSAFINSDIRKAIQQGATRADITAGIVTSIVSNYLNRVVGNRTIGNKIFLQGGVAKNKAVPLAFAMLLDKEILVPPSPELMGCFGVGILAAQKNEEGFLDKTEFDLDKVLETVIDYDKVFTCKSCHNLCPIQILNVNNHKYMFGGRCNKYANSKRKVNESVKVVDYVEQRNDLLFVKCAPDQETMDVKRHYTVGIPKSFSVHTMYPLYSWFFYHLGIKTILSTEISHEGIARVESSYCFPAEIAHGAVQNILDKGADYILVPHYRDMDSLEKDVHANFCPITQAQPYYIKKAFPEVPEDKFLQLVVTFKFGEEKALEYFIKMGQQLSIDEGEIRKAFKFALAKQQDYFKKAMALGQKALEETKKEDRAVIALLGRPYNAFTAEANMGIPRKFSSRGYSIIPFDILPVDEEKIFPNMYWYYGQLDMKATVMLKDIDNVFITYITNFSCAPDSFILHYIKWIMGTKPFLILELDSHSADAGIDTRVEAFLDIIEGYRSKLTDSDENRYDNGLRFINTGDENIHLMNIHSNKRIEIRDNKKVKVLLSNMGNLSTEMVGTIMRSNGFDAIALPQADQEVLRLARSHASGKECVPSHLVLGSALRFFNSDQYKKDEIYMLFVPITTGPCRTGQYFVFYENLFKDMKLENVIVFTMSADNSYTELGPNFSKHFWRGAAAADYMKDIQTSLRACAMDPKSALARFHDLWDGLIVSIERDFNTLLPELKTIGKELAKIPLKRKMEDCPKVLVVGEIYVRRDDFAVDELIELFCRKEIIAKVAGLGEWIHYLDFVRTYDLKKRIKLQPWYKKAISRERRALTKLNIEKAWKHSTEHNIKSALTTSGLIPSAPDNMEKMMENSSEHFVNHELNSEITVSTGSAATAMDEGFSGVVNISPFACLIGRVIEGLYTPWARERNFPTMSVEVDGNMLPPNIINKLNIFMINVLRFRNNPGIAELIETEEPAYGKEESCCEDSSCSTCGSGEHSHFEEFIKNVE